MWVRVVKNPAFRTRPVIKWAGGKRQLILQYSKYFPDKFAVYHEPFLGGGAVFFHLAPRVAYLSDANEELINMYRVLQSKVELLIEDLSRHRNEKEYFYHVRDMDVGALSDVERASRLIYLNKTCYNGLYRVNSKGKFNVPFGGYKNPRIVDREALVSASRALQGAVIQRSGFEVVLENAGPGDFVYFDPPYNPVSNTAYFTSYTEQSFSIRDQERLAGVFDELARRGCKVMLSNSDTPFIRSLFEKYSRGIIPIMARRSINSKGDGRGPVGEIIVCSWLKQA
ncbi:MAG: DNA adenine methylase [Bacillota bacterium]